MVKQELMGMYRQNAGQLPAGTIAGIMWDIVVDVAQFFYTFPSNGDFSANPQQNMPASTLSVKRSLLSANLHIAALNNPKRWLPTVVPYTTYNGGNNALGYTRQQQQRESESRNRERGSGGDGVNGGLGSGGDTGDGKETVRGIKRERSDTQVRNLDMHPILKTMMQPVLDKKYFPM